MKLWLDDIRTPPDASWTWVKTVADAIGLMEAGVTEASLDHDLGQDDDGRELPEGRTLVYWMAENDCWPTEAISIHSANVVGVDYMVGMIERYGPFVRVGHAARFTRQAGQRPDRPDADRGHLEPWTRGCHGKFLIDASGKFHAWRVNDSQAPHHAGAADQIGVLAWLLDGVIDPDGSVHPTAKAPGGGVVGLITQALTQIEAQGMTYGARSTGTCR